MSQTDQTETEPHYLGRASLITFLKENSTQFRSISDTGPGRWAVEIPIAGGYSVAFNATAPFRVRHIVGRGDGDVITLHLVQKQ